MAYENKNNGILFPNKNKKEHKHPDFKGKHYDETGKEFQISAWVKKDRNGNEFLTYIITEAYGG